MARARKFFSFNLEIEAHKKALEILENRGCSSDFVVECILQNENRLTREELHQELQEFLQNLPPVVPDPTQQQPVPQEEKPCSASRIPKEMFDIMKQL